MITESEPRLMIGVLIFMDSVRDESVNLGMIYQRRLRNSRNTGTIVRIVTWKIKFLNNKKQKVGGKLTIY